MKVSKGELPKAIALIALILFSFIYLFMRLKSILIPKGPNAVAQMANSAPPAGTNAPVATPPPSGATVPGPGGATGASVPAGGPVSAGSAGTTGAPGILSPSGAPTGPAHADPNVIPNVVVRDPFALTPSYKRQLPDPNKVGNSSSSSKPPVTVHSLDETPAPSHRRVPLTTGPALTTPVHSWVPAPTGDAKSVGSGGTTSPVPPQSGNPESTKGAAAPASENAEYALTGTIQGEFPMAILRSKERNLLVREGDWLDDQTRVLRIATRRVLLKDRSGRSRVLILGATPHAS